MVLILCHETYDLSGIKTEVRELNNLSDRHPNELIYKPRNVKLHE